MGKDMSELASYFEPLAQDLLDKCYLAGIQCRVIDTGRTPEEQVVKLETKVSWTSHSKHEPQLPEGKSEAIDICPLAILAEHKVDWDSASPLWLQIGEIGEGIGLKWGGRWHLHPDPSHFEYVHEEHA